MTLPAGYASRPATWDDLDAVVERFNVGDRADVGFEEPIRGHLEEEWRTPTFDLASSTLMAFKDHWRYEPCPSISTSSRWVGWIPEGKEVVGVAPRPHDGGVRLGDVVAVRRAWRGRASRTPSCSAASRGSPSSGSDRSC